MVESSNSESDTSVSKPDAQAGDLPPEGPWEDQMPMPKQVDGLQTRPADTTSDTTSWGRQVAQLVVIPAVIVIICITMAVLFGRLAGAKDSIDTHLLKLQQSSGAGKLAMGLQDPRYKDRGLAAYNIATMIRRLTDVKEKQRVSSALAKILQEHVADDEQLLQSYLLIALGQLGQEGGMKAILIGLQSAHPKVRQSAIAGILSWPDQETARLGLDGLLERLEDQNPAVRTAAAAALGRIAQQGDQRVIARVRTAMEASAGLVMREARWNAAVTLAKLGDAGGGRFVATVLLDREALSQMPAGESGRASEDKMPIVLQDRVILSTLASLAEVDSPLLWDQVRNLADNDPSRPVRNAARKLMMTWQEQQRS